MAVVLLLALMLCIMAMRVFLPWGAALHGKVLRTITLSFRERMLLQRTNLYLISAVVIVTAAAGVLSYGLELVVILAAFAILTIPVRYRITSEGIALNNVVFRPWSDFSGYHDERLAVVLEGAGQRGFRIHALGANRDAVHRALAPFLGTPAARRTPGGARARSGVRP